MSRQVLPNLFAWHISTTHTHNHIHGIDRHKTHRVFICYHVNVIQMSSNNDNLWSLHENAPRKYTTYICAVGDLIQCCGNSSSTDTFACENRVVQQLTNDILFWLRVKHVKCVCTIY